MQVVVISMHDAAATNYYKPYNQLIGETFDLTFRDVYAMRLLYVHLLSIWRQGYSLPVKSLAIVMDIII